MNNVNLLGRLTKDPELKHLEDNRAICNFTIAIDDPYSHDDHTDFVRITAFGKQAENSAKYLRKGLRACVNGRLHTESYTDSAGVKRYPVSVRADRVQFLDMPQKEQHRDEPERTER